MREGFARRDIAAQNSKPSLRTRHEHVRSVVIDQQVVLAIAQEREVVIRKPRQQFGTLSHIVWVKANRWRLEEFGTQQRSAITHSWPILNRCAPVFEH